MGDLNRQNRLTMDASDYYFESNGGAAGLSGKNRRRQNRRSMPAEVGSVRGGRAVAGVRVERPASKRLQLLNFESSH